ncbi:MULTISPECIES: TauD/TfdA dioxygenase family protein [unclassified Sphingomonas]|uniref:TauD/TfdA dioxygenase family protein n=1 Tax=unclassified Sphingomonas TaxID=196159 RepID=UPI0006F6DBAB|nr:MULTISPECIES: TauD/TfdA family dioxygenase [unclassified Sphingomonas]KQX23590.1 hypothetical protein ASD17_03760 [Sphingomonas sp. Root1294]KQY68438.1 hypothetical protein ASD39_06280 [Sphingomonas sp. Root50]KRB91395.1 hypothetical protein ASE22_13085 [Sphingomonas sp. Root720]
MAIAFQPIQDGFAARVTGVALASELDRETVAAINDGMDRYAVLVFNRQPLEQAEQIAFACRFGALDLGLRKAVIHSKDRTYAATRLDYEALMDISNVDNDGALSGPESRRMLSNLANQLWHSDSSFQQDRVSYSMLSAVICPASGGDTEFADMRMAYDALDDATKAYLEPLEAEHFAFHSRELLGAFPTEEERDSIPPAVWPIVSRLRNGRRSLFIGAHARKVLGIPTAQGRMLLMDLLEHATQRSFVYRHQWAPGDLVIWDNRTTLHRGRPYDTSQRRELRRTTILEDAA